MAANKFATMLHKNTNKITLILIYAVLEWILILLLLLNSLFSYLIIKFAEFFGLNPPCLLCTRLDHIFDSSKGNKNMIIDLLCEAHSKEISKLGLCSNHQKLAQSHEMCEDCLSSSDLGFLNRVREFGTGQENVGKNFGEISLNCSCCGVSLKDNSNIYSSYILLKTSSWDVLECAQKENLILNAEDYDIDYHVEEKNFSADLCDDVIEGLENENVTHVLAEFDGSCLDVTENKQVYIVNEKKEIEGGGTENSPQHLEFFLDYSGHKLVPVELIDPITEEHKIDNREHMLDSVVEKEELIVENGSKLSQVDKLFDVDINEEANFGLDSEVRVETKEELVVENGSRLTEVDKLCDVDFKGGPEFVAFESMEVKEDENALVFESKDRDLEFEQFTGFSSDVQELVGAGEKDSDVHIACDEMENNESEADVSIGTEIPDLDVADEIHDDPSTSSINVYEADYTCEEQMMELQSLSVHDWEHTMNNDQSFKSELNEIEEDKVPDTPTSVDSLNQLRKKLLLLEKRDSGNEESLDGSVTSELDGGDGVVTIERLKSALREERKALQVLYAELEEERSASAVAANQTMAMINRLQEEKAAMQMEALQYQRMMEEQSEYDQEAMQLLNELMVKREKEKQELEKELDLYRKKLFDYETKEKIRVLRKSKDGSTRSVFSSASFSNGEDSEDLSIDLNQEAKEEEGFYSNRECTNYTNTPIDVVVDLEESLADFEEERMFILEQLKVLEEKLMTLDDEKDQHFEDVRELEDFHQENGDHVHINGEGNGHHENGFSNEMNGKRYQKRRTAGQNGKSLLPLFDAISDENGDMVSNGNGNANGIDSNGSENSYVSKFEMENKKLAIEEEVEHLYERLQAFEADREFLKHCISSMKKGDKGMDLLQEILQHLRDLRNVELRVRNLSDGT